MKTTNVKNFIGLVENLINKPENIPKMGLVYGEPGLGKSQTALWLACKYDAIYLRATRLTGRWSTVFGTQLAEVHEQAHGSAHKKADQQIERAEDNNDGHDDRAYHQTGADGDNGVPLGADGDQVRLGRVHGLNQGKSGAEVKKKLS